MAAAGIARAGGAETQQLPIVLRARRGPPAPPAAPPVTTRAHARPSRSPYRPPARSTATGRRARRTRPSRLALEEEIFSLGDDETSQPVSAMSRR